MGGDAREGDSRQVGPAIAGGREAEGGRVRLPLLTVANRSAQRNYTQPINQGLLVFVCVCELVCSRGALLLPAQAYSTVCICMCSD